MEDFVASHIDNLSSTDYGKLNTERPGTPMGKVGINLPTKETKVIFD